MFKRPLKRSTFYDQTEVSVLRFILVAKQHYILRQTEKLTNY